MSMNLEGEHMSPKSSVTNSILKSKNSKKGISNHNTVVVMGEVDSITAGGNRS